MGLLTLGFVVDKPSGARWLATELEKQLVVDDLEADRHKTGPRQHKFGEALKLPQLWLLTATYFCGTMCQCQDRILGSQHHPDFGVESTSKIGFLSAVAYV
jgi:hypothetical protein